MKFVCSCAINEGQRLVLRELTREEAEAVLLNSLEMQGDSVENCFPNSSLHCFSGPDGIANVRAHLLKDAPPIETGAYTRERTVDLEYLWRPAPGTPFHRPRATFSGEVGWHSWFFLDTDPIKTGHQIHLSEIRRQVEDNCTHLYQKVWKPKRVANIPKDGDGPRSQKKRTSNDFTSLQHGYDPRPVPLQWKPWSKPPQSTMITYYPSPHSAWVDDNSDWGTGDVLYHEAKAKGQNFAVEDKTTPPNILTPKSSNISPAFNNSANSTASGISLKSRASYRKSDDRATPLGVQATSPQQISSNDQNVNRGASDLFVTLQAIDDASSQVGLNSVDALPCISKTSHLSFSSAGSGRSQGSQPITPRSQASSITSYSHVRVPRRLSSALELGRKENFGYKLTRSLSVDQTLHKFHKDPKKKNNYH